MKFQAYINLFMFTLMHQMIRNVFILKLHVIHRVQKAGFSSVINLTGEYANI